MQSGARTPAEPLRSRPALVAVYIVALAVFLRTFVLNEQPALVPWYTLLQGAFLFLFTALWWRGLPLRLRPLLLGALGGLVLVMLLLNPGHDFVTGLFVLLSYQAALVMPGKSRWAWIGVFVLLIPVSLMILIGPLRGLALAFVPMAVAIVLSAYVAVRDELEASRAESERMIGELETTHRRLEAYAAQVEELAGIEERNRLARELHDSVSQTIFSIQLLTSSAQMVLNDDPQAVQPQLERLRELTQAALGHMRSLIADLDNRPSPPSAPQQPHLEIRPGPS